LPLKDNLPRVHHTEQEGMFRFGRSLFEEEKIVFKEKEVLKHFQEAVQKFSLYAEYAENERKKQKA
jgi:hypothetical protein